VNPRRPEVGEALSQAGIAVLSIEALMRRIHRLTGTPTLPQPNGRVVAVVEDRAGGILSTIRTLE
jgi:citrate lyase subunit alpha / citrate CoA-transferase